jgi:hypothetical protein
MAYHCKLCGKGFRSAVLVREHRKHDHTPERNATPDLVKEMARARESIEYSFYNSPRELVLELSDVTITIRKRTGKL